MIKKILLAIICILFMSNISAQALPSAQKIHLKPLKIEEKTEYKYGNIEKTLKNSGADEKQIEENNARKTSSVLDVINTVMLCIFGLIFLVLFYAKVNNRKLSEIFKKNKNDNSFQILSAKQLGEGKTVYLLEVNGRQIIVGTTVSKVDSIMPLDKSYSTEEIPPEYIEKLFNNTSTNFKNLEE